MRLVSIPEQVYPQQEGGLRKERPIGDRAGIIAYFDSYDARSNMGYRFSLEHFEDKKLISRLTAKSIKYDSLYQWTVIDI